MMIRLLFYIIIGAIVLYVLKVGVIVMFVDNAMVTWNYIIDYVLTFKDRQPLLFLCLPLLLFYLLWNK